MSRPRPLLRRGALALVAAAAAATLVPAPSGADDASARVAPRPEVGQCRALTQAESAAVSDPDRAIPCGRSHTARTIRVVPVKPRVLRDQDAMLAAGTRACSPALARALGGTAKAQAMSAYSYAFFAPTRAQQRAGQHWLRCDVVLRGGRRLLPLPTDETPALGSLPHPDGVARCGTVLRGGFFRTACSRSHDYRAEGTVGVRGKRYPGDAALNRVAQRRCTSVAGTRDWWATWPSELGWKLGGERMLVCYARTPL